MALAIPERTRATGVVILRVWRSLECGEDILDLHAFMRCNALEYCPKRPDRQIVIIGYGDSLKSRGRSLEPNVATLLGDEMIIPTPTKAFNQIAAR